MSLKAFHIVFIVASIILAFGFAGWAFHDYLHEGPRLHLFFGVVSTAAGVGLVFYGRYVLRKLKKISFL
jgi:hypothetical protein